MFVVSLNYLKSLPEVDQHLEAHVAWLKAQYAAGRFIASGRKVPRTGGVILARGTCRAELESWLAADPFARRRQLRPDRIRTNHDRTRIHPLIRDAGRMMPALGEQPPC